jgi:hypothetical protein
MIAQAEDLELIGVENKDLSAELTIAILNHQGTLKAVVTRIFSMRPVWLLGYTNHGIDSKLDGPPNQYHDSALNSNVWSSRCMK